MRDIDKINRLVCYPTAQIYNASASYPKGNNTFVYFRAPEGYMYELVAVDISANLEGPKCNGILEVSDGHYYTGWDIFPGVENRETLARSSHDADTPNAFHNMHGWECKEFTIGVRSTSNSQQFKCCVIIWFFMRKMNKLETLFYALAHPLRKRYKKAFMTTLDRFEE